MFVNNIKNAVLISYITIIFSIVSGVIYTPWLITQIGISEYGLYSLAMSIIGFFTLDFGLGLAVSKFLSEYYAKRDFYGANKFIQSVYILFLVISLFLLLVFVFVYFLIDGFFLELTSVEIEKLKNLYLIAGFFSVFCFIFKPLDGILISNEKFVFIKSLELFYKLFNLVFIVISLYLGYGLYSLVIVNSFFGFLNIFIKYVYIKNICISDYRLSTKFSINSYGKLFKFSGWVTIGYIAQRFILLITPAILAAKVGSSEVAIFSIALVIEGYVWMIASNLGGLFLPRVSNLLTNLNSKNEIENLMIKVGRLQLIVIGLILILFVFVGQNFILLWVGEDFINSYYIVCCLIAHSIVTLPQEVAQTTLLASNKIQYKAFASLIIAFISFPLTLTFVPENGAVAAAISILIANFFGSVIFMNAIYLKVLKLDLLNFFIKCHGEFLLPLSITIVFSYVVNLYYQSSALSTFIYKVIIISLLYIILLWVLTLNKYEKNIFIGVFSKLVKRKVNVSK